MSLLSMITTELPNPEYHHQKFQMLSIRSWTYHEYEIATEPDLARSIRSKYQHVALLYDRILRHRKIIVNKPDTVWNWAFNMPCKSLKGILVLFDEGKPYTRDKSKFYNPKILWLDSRMIYENDLHGTGRRIENASEGITLQIEKKEESAGALNAYIYLIMDAQLNIQNGAYISAVY